MEGAEKRLIVFVRPYGSSFESVIQKMTDTHGAAVHEVATAVEALTLIRQAGSGVMVLFCLSETELERLVLLQRAARMGKHVLKLLVTSGIRDENINGQASSLMECEVLAEPVNEKGLAFKIERLFKSLPKDARPAAQSAARPMAEAAPESGEGESLFEEVAPLKLESDCWLQIKGGVRQIGGRWVMRLQGPPPAAGSWHEVDVAGAPTEAWQWVPADPAHDPYIREQGAWVFFGQRPDSLRERQGLAWVFISRQPRLIFVHDGKSYGAKFALSKTGVLEIAADSEKARAHLSQGLAAGVSPAASMERDREGGGHGLGGGHVAWASAPALELASDCWIRGPRPPAHAGKRWTVSLMGPLPEHGKWVASEGTADQWEWKPNDPENDPFILEEGGWIFRGAQPKFQDEQWHFAGEAPDLSFVYSGETYGSKIQIDGQGTLQLAANSPAAEEFRRLIMDSLEKAKNRVARAARPRDDDLAPDAESVLATTVDIPVPASTAPSEAEAQFFDLPESTFGADAVWACASVGSRARRWYVLIPTTLQTHLGRVDVRKVHDFWTYFGPAAPEARSGVVRFRARAPQKVHDFPDLPKKVQDFLLEYVPGNSEGGQTVFRVERTRFGMGDWEATSFGTLSRRWYVYLPPEVVSHAPVNVKTLAEYWVYFGSAAPRLVEDPTQSSFEFREREPTRFEHFRDLPRTVKLFLRSYFLPESAAETPESLELASAADLNDPSITWLPREHFDSTGGAWESAGSVPGREKRSTYLHVPARWKSHDSTLLGPLQIRRAGPYWSYSAVLPPILGIGPRQGQWGFREAQPVRQDRFQDLDRDQQQFLTTRFPETMPGEPNIQLTARSEPPSEAIPDAITPGYVAAESWPEPVAKKTLPAEIVIPLPPAKTPVGGTTETPVIPISVAAMARQFTAAEAEVPVAAEPAQVVGPAAVEGRHPSEPALSAVALAVIMAELVAKRDLDRKKVGVKYCEYLAASLGGLRVELWARTASSPEGWFCLGASDGGDGNFGSVLPGLSASGTYGIKAGDILFAPVRRDSTIVGALLIAGREVEQVEETYATAAAKVTFGLVEGLSRAA